MVGNLDKVFTRRVGKFRLKGKENDLEIFELMGFSGLEDTRYFSLRKQFNDALLKFELGDWTAARVGFKSTLTIHAGDGPSKFYLRYCERYLRNGPPPDWDGVITLTQK